MATVVQQRNYQDLFGEKQFLLQFKIETDFQLKNPELLCQFTCLQLCNGSRDDQSSHGLISHRPWGTCVFIHCCQLSSTAINSCGHTTDKCTIAAYYHLRSTMKHDRFFARSLFKRDSFPDNCVLWTNENVSFGA